MKAYHLHTDVLEEHSPFFRARANFRAANSSEEPSHVVLRHITTCDTFDMVVEYLYTLVYTIPEQLGVEETCLLHIRIYHLANYLMMDDLRRLALAQTKTTLKGDDWGPLRHDWTSRAIVDLLRLVYDDTMQVQTNASSAYDDGLQTTTTEAEQSQYGSNEENREGLLSTSEAREESDTVSCPLQEMRTLVARFTASRLDGLRHDPEFKQMIRVGGDMVADVFSFVQPGVNL